MSDKYRSRRHLVARTCRIFVRRDARLAERLGAPLGRGRPVFNESHRAEPVGRSNANTIGLDLIVWTTAELLNADAAAKGDEDVPAGSFRPLSALA